MKTKILLFLFLLVYCSCLQKDKSDSDREGKDLNLNYEMLTRNSLFPNDSIEFNTGYLLIDIPENSRYIDIAESIKTIGLKENLVSAKIFISKVGFLMEVDSIERKYSDFNESFLGFYDLTTKGLNWKYQFKTEDVKFNGVDTPLNLNIK